MVAVMRGFPPPAAERVAPDAVHSSPHAVRWFMQHIRESTRTASVLDAEGLRAVTRFEEAPRALDDALLAGIEDGSWTFSRLA